MHNISYLFYSCYYNYSKRHNKFLPLVLAKAIYAQKEVRSYEGDSSN